jgi:hypothetical protein
MGNPKRRKSKLERIEWGSVNIDKRMIEAIRKVITKVYGYKSVADYVQDAVRRKLQLDEARLSMEEMKDEEKD